MTTDFYTVLGLPSNATKRQIRERFLELAREQHPDRIQGEKKAQAELDFQAITEAFNVLSDPERRREHDLAMAGPGGSEMSEVNQAAQVAQVYLKRGIKAYKANNFLEAAENFDRATQESPKDAQAWHYLALAASQRRTWLPRAAEASARACELDPLQVPYLKLAGRLFAEIGQVSKAEKYFSEALTWEADDEEIHAALEELDKGKKGKTGLFGRNE